MEAKVKIDPRIRAAVGQKAQANMEMCWTCQCCTSECPVNIATKRLNPAKIVRLANLGLLEELLRTPAVWYCQACNRCAHICPMNVHPPAVIQYARNEAVRLRRISFTTVRQLKDLLGRFQRVRFHMVRSCLENGDTALSRVKWQNLIEARVKTPPGGENSKILLNRKPLRMGFGVSSCFTCSECTNVCPVFHERSIFDPQWIFRMVNLGLEREILQSPAIWLCLGCQRCSAACSQLVKGHLVIENLQNKAVAQGFVPASFPLAWKDLGAVMYPYLLHEIDSLLKITL